MAGVICDRKIVARVEKKVYRVVGKKTGAGKTEDAKIFIGSGQGEQVKHFVNKLGRQG